MNWNETKRTVGNAALTVAAVWIPIVGGYAAVGVEEWNLTAALLASGGVVLSGFFYRTLWDIWRGEPGETQEYLLRVNTELEKVDPPDLDMQQEIEADAARDHEKENDPLES